MAENLMNQSHKATNETFRKAYSQMVWDSQRNFVEDYNGMVDLLESETPSDENQ